MGPKGPTKGNAQLIRHFRTSVTVWFRKFVCLFKKRHHIAKTAWRSVPRDPSSISLAITFTRKSAFRYSCTLDARVGRWILDSGCSTLDAGLWTLDPGCWTVDAGLWTLDPATSTVPPFVAEYLRKECDDLNEVASR